MRLFDTSNYCTDEVIENLLVEVLPVNLSTWVTFRGQKDFSIVLNSSNLRYNKVLTTGELIALPDGIYEFKMSIKPNILTVHHFYHLRTTDMERSIQSEYSKLIDNRCKMDRKDLVKSRDALRNIDEYLRASKWMVEECLDKKKGKELYEFTQSLLDQYTNECKC